MSATLDPLRTPAIRCYFLVFALSNIGTFAQYSAFTYLVVTSTTLRGAAEAAALVGIARAVPSFVLTPFIGKVLDVWPDRTGMVAGNALFALTSLGLGLATFAYPRPSIPVLCAAWAVAGVATTIESPSRSAWVRRLVGPDAYPRAISWQGLAFNFPALAAPLLGGWLTARYSAGWAFFLNAGLTSCFIVTVLSMPARLHDRSEGAPVTRGLGALLAHVRATPALGFISTAQAVIGLTLCAAAALIPALVLGRNLGSGSYAIAEVMCAQGIAGTLGFLVTPHLARAAAPALVGAMVLGGLALVGLGYDLGFAGSMVLASAVTLATTLGFATANIVAQAAGGSEFRARIAYITLFVFCCIGPLSALAMGRIAAAVSLGPVVSATGWICLALTAALVLTTSPAISGLQLRLQPASKPSTLDEPNH